MPWGRTSVTGPSQSSGFVHAGWPPGCGLVLWQLIRSLFGSLRLRSTRVHASVRGQRDGRQHDAGSMQFRCAHLIGVLDMIGISPEHGITGTASRGDLEGPRSGGQQSGTCIFSRHEAPEYRSGSRCHPSTCGAESRQCAGPAQPSPACQRDGVRFSPPRFGAMSPARNASSRLRPRTTRVED